MAIDDFKLSEIAQMNFRFTIRDLLWLTALVAVCIAWWLDHRRLDSAMRNFQIEAADLLEKLSQKEVIYLNGERASKYHTAKGSVIIKDGK